MKQGEERDDEVCKGVARSGAWLVGWVGVRVLGEAYIYRCF